MEKSPATPKAGQKFELTHRRNNRTRREYFPAYRQAGRALQRVFLKIEWIIEDATNRGRG